MNYRNYNDNELVSFVEENHEEAQDILFEKYKPFIVSTANKMQKTCKYNGLEINDLIQEGFLGLTNAIIHFNEQKDTSFYTFAKTCIERRMISLIISTKRLKHKILNESLSLDGNDDNDIVGLETFLGDSNSDPENVLIYNEEKSELINNIKNKLTDFEEQVFELKINNFNYREIANILDRTPKAIDNALQRIKTKAKEELEIKS
ncbi:MAG: sigma-70 family RNA polymerase sigma factor [Bacilli bacterium]|nr:sigma-70 family RNA polymerase sigma factor [Bacilli bacterium]MDD4282435.1 sigma-70 family RNA polymerase sigma factor [Bacilli bacterium]